MLGKVQRKVNKGDAPIELEQLVPGFEAFRGDSTTSAQKHNLRTKPSLLASRQLHTFP